MTFKEELSALRGLPIELKPDPDSIPCIETSDLERLCRQPVVSVNMCTYNQEKYIQQAIEGVLMQKTDFEFELIIGEDASTDRTREICFDFQKRYPEKIRVLWSERNVNDIGGNFIRVRSRSRGEFIAICEGDDFWVDPYKLQKQVDAMRQHLNVSYCFAESDILLEQTGKRVSTNAVRKNYPSGVIPGEKVAVAVCNPCTATYMMRTSAYREACQRFDIFKWRLSLGDKTIRIGLSLMGDAYCFHDIFSVYRIHSAGMMGTQANVVYRDGGIVSLYFSKVSPVFPCWYAYRAIRQVMLSRLSIIAQTKTFSARSRCIIEMVRMPCWGSVLLDLGFWRIVFAVLGVGSRTYCRVSRGVRSRVQRILGTRETLYTIE